LHPSDLLDRLSWVLIGGDWHRRDRVGDLAWCGWLPGCGSVFGYRLRLAAIQEVGLEENGAWLDCGSECKTPFAFAAGAQIGY